MRHFMREFSPDGSQLLPRPYFLYFRRVIPPVLQNNIYFPRFHLFLSRARQMFMCVHACMFVCVVADEENEGVPQQEFDTAFCTPEPEDPNCEQDLPADFEDGKSNLTL